MNRITPHLLAVARGDAPADLLISGGSVFNVFTGEIHHAKVAIAEGRIAGIGDYAPGAETIDARGLIVCPGLLDAHMHVESTMMPPSRFIPLALARGTVGAVFDPHEIANVLGVPGIRYLMDDAAAWPFCAMWALSSCVPSSSLETAGATIEAADLTPLFDAPGVVALAEMMNYPGVVAGDPGILAKLNLAHARGRIIDGHAPGLSGGTLNAYIAAGITSDHECITLEEAREKLRLGMTIFIREGSAARNLEALLPLVTAETKHLFCFCTDDRHPADLASEGHIDHVIRKAIRLGLPPAWALAMGSLHTARHYGVRDLGAVAPGYRACLILIEAASGCAPRLVLHDGRIVARDGEYTGPTPVPISPPSGVVRLPQAMDAGSFRIPAPDAPFIRVIEMRPDQIVTGELRLTPRMENGACLADPGRDILKLAVIERHRGTGRIGLGFVRGFGFTRGAIASTVGHDSHNLAVVGTNDEDMSAAAKALAAAGGGQCVVAESNVLAMLRLPIAGLMSGSSADELIADQRTLLDAAAAIGCPHADPFMPLSFLVLPVIPTLKLTDLGLIDVRSFSVVGLGAQ